MFLTQNDLSQKHEGRIRRANEGDVMTNAADIFSKIEEFLALSHLLNLTRPEEETLMSLDPEQWERWRSMTIAPTAIAPSLLIRRLDYAIALLNRMVTSSAPGPTWAGPGESRL
jgi:hypothetical protein